MQINNQVKVGAHEAQGVTDICQRSRGTAAQREDLGIIRVPTYMVTTLHAATYRRPIIYGAPRDLQEPITRHGDTCMPMITTFLVGIGVG